MSLILAWIIHFFCFANAKWFCQPPNVPLGGSYSPVQSKYLPGDQIVYTCKPGFLMIGGDHRVEGRLSCEVSGNWSAAIPFCDPPTRMVSPLASLRFMKYDTYVPNLVDGNTNSCYTIHNSSHISVSGILGEATIISGASFYIHKVRDQIGFRMHTNNTMGRRTLCYPTKKYTDQNEWIQLECQNEEGITSNSLELFVTSKGTNTLDLCEIEIFDEEDYPVKVNISQVLTASRYSPGNVSNLVDDNIDTCVTLHETSARQIRIYLEARVILLGFRIFLHKGYVDIAVHAYADYTKFYCANIATYLKEDQWIQYYCYRGMLEDFIDSIEVVDNLERQLNFTVCEIEVFVESDCEKPPQIVIPNGHLEVSRKKASLRCNTGFTGDENQQLFCDNSKTWTGPDLHCNEVLCELPDGNSSGGEWHLEKDKPSVGSTKILQCQEPEFELTGEPANVTCQENGIWTSTNATCVRTEEVKNMWNIMGVVVGAVSLLMLLTCTGITLYFIYMPKKKEVVVAFLATEYETSTNFEPKYHSEPESTYYEIRDSYFYDKPESEYYETPIR